MKYNSSERKIVRQIIDLHVLQNVLIKKWNKYQSEINELNKSIGNKYTPQRHYEVKRVK